MTDKNQPQDERIPDHLRDSSMNRLFYHEVTNSYANLLGYKDRRIAKGGLPTRSRSYKSEMGEEEIYRENVRDDCIEAHNEIAEMRGGMYSIREGPIAEILNGIRRRLEEELQERGANRPVLDLDYLSDKYLAEFYGGTTRFYPESARLDHLGRDQIISPEMEPTVAEFNGLVEQVKEMQDPAKVDRDKLDDLLLGISERLEVYSEGNGIVKFYELYDQLGRTPNFEELKEILGEEE